MQKLRDMLEILHQVMGWDWMNFALLLSVLCVAILFLKAQLIPHDGFDLRHMVAEKHGSSWEVDPRRFRLTGAFLVMTFGFVWLVVHDKLTEWYFAGYGCMWVLEKVVDKFKIEIPPPTSEQK